MSLRIRVIIIVLMFLFLVNVIRHLHKKRLDFKMGFVWMAGALVITFFAIFPKTLSALTSLIGVELPINLLFFIGLSLAFFIIFYLGRQISTQNEKIRQLTQELAIMRHKIESDTKEIHKDSGLDEH